MKRISSLLLALALLFTLAGCGKELDPPEPPVSETPALSAELSVFRDNLTLLASNEAEKLSGNEFAVAFLDMIASGSGTSYKEYPNLKATLDQIALSYGAYQVYLLTDLDDDITSLEVAVSSNTDGGEPICAFGEHHKAEYALSSAYAGTPAADMFARTWTRKDGSSVLTWTAYAPVLDSNGAVACLLAFEYPSTDFLSAYPEWNRMNAEWNGVIEPAE